MGNQCSTSTGCCQKGEENLNRTQEFGGATLTDRRSENDPFENQSLEIFS